jgi:hypothetical protein
MTARALAARIFAGVVVLAAIGVAVVLVSVGSSDKAADVEKVAVRNSARLTANDRKDKTSRRCQTTSRDVQRCIELIDRGRDQSETIERTGRTGSRGLNGLRGKTGPTGPRGPAGRNGRDARAPSAQRLAEGFAIWCSQMPCVGANGPAGKDAPPVTPDDLRAALLEVCSGSCNGTDGQDAPPPTQDQVNAAVAMVCAMGGCPASPGPKGDQGAQGEQGPAGPAAARSPCAEQDPALGYACAPPVP